MCIRIFVSCMQVFFCDRIYFHQQFFIQHLLEVRRQFPERFFASKKAKKNQQYNIGFAAMLADGRPINFFFAAVHLYRQDVQHSAFFFIFIKSFLWQLRFRAGRYKIPALQQALKRCASLFSTLHLTS